MPTVLKESNVISLRTAIVSDDGNRVSLRLMPVDVTSFFPEDGKWSPKHFEWVSQDSVWLYRHLRSDVDERELMNGPPCVDQDLKPLALTSRPAFSLVWEDSGHNVALYMNGAPWAFICELGHVGYSKGILVPQASRVRPLKHPWDQRLFEITFK